MILILVKLQNSVTLFMDVLFRSLLRIRVKKFFFFRYQHMFLDPTMTFIAKCYHFVYK